MILLGLFPAFSNQNSKIGTHATEQQRPNLQDKLRTNNYFHLPKTLTEIKKGRLSLVMKFQTQIKHQKISYFNSFISYKVQKENRK